MISHLRGNIIFRGKDFIVLDVNGVGYKVFLSEKTLLKLPKEDDQPNPVRSKTPGASADGQAHRTSNGVKLFTFLNWREDTVELYGFLTPSELELFETLNGISGVGPRTALQLASFGSLERLKHTIEEGKIAIKGIGRKKLQKIMLELTGKIRELQKAPADKGDREEDEALEALVALGFSRARARSALNRVANNVVDTRRRIKEALNILS